MIERARAKFKSFVHVLHYVREEFLDDLSDSITFAQDLFFSFQMRDYNALFDWLEKFKLTIYIDNFVKGGFDMTSVHGITAEVRNSRAYRSCGVIITHSIVMKKEKSFIYHLIKCRHAM